MFRKEETLKWKTWQMGRFGFKANAGTSQRFEYYKPSLNTFINQSDDQEVYIQYTFGGSWDC